MFVIIVIRCKTFTMLSLVICWFCIFFPQTTLGYSAENITQLKSTLLKSYDNQVRPSKNFDEDLKIDVNLVFRQINGVSEINQIMSSFAKVKLKWKDDYLTWDKNQTDIEKFLIPEEDIWTPDINVYNGQSSIGSSESKSKQIEIDSNGKVKWIQFISFETKCSIDVTFYPFDNQSCEIVFILLNDDGIRISSVSIDTEITEVRDDWIIESTKSRVKNKEGRSRAVFIFNIKRKPYRVLLEFVLPVIMMAFLDLLTFFIPCDSGEKISFATTMYLALSVYTFILTSYLPESSDNSVLAIFLKTILAIETAVVAVTTLQLRIYHQAKNPDPSSWVKTVCRIANKTSCQRNKNAVVQISKEKQPPEFEEDQFDGKEIENACDNLDRIFFWVFALAMCLAVTISVARVMV